MHKHSQNNNNNNNMHKGNFDPVMKLKGEVASI